MMPTVQEIVFWMPGVVVGASVLAAECGAQVSGLDAAEGLIAFARNRFDAVFAANSVQYSENRIVALRELGRVCTPRGRIVAGLFGPPEKVKYSAVFKAARDVIPEPPPGDGPFEPSTPEKVEGIFEEAGLKVIESGEVACPFNYPDVETFWRASVSAGPVQGMLRIVSEEELKSASRNAFEIFRLDSGGYLIQPNVFKYVVATR